MRTLLNPSLQSANILCISDLVTWLSSSFQTKIYNYVPPYHPKHSTLTTSCVSQSDRFTRLLHVVSSSPLLYVQCSPVTTRSKGRTVPVSSASPGHRLAEHHILIAVQLSWAAVQESASASHGARGEADAGADAEGVARAGVHRRALPRRLRVLPAPPGGHTAQRRRHLEGIRRSEGRAVPAAVGKGRGGGALREFLEEAANGILEEADERRGGGQEVAQLLGVDYLERKEG